MPSAEVRAGGVERGEKRLLGNRTRRIVIVEDEDVARGLLKDALESRGHTVYQASNGEEAVALVEREVPDIAFIDIGLPLLNGYAVARCLRSKPKLVGVRLVALTGLSAPRHLAAAAEAGFDEHLTKPADIPRIEAAIRAV